jgi:hypothetical protein
MLVELSVAMAIIAQLFCIQPEAEVSAQVVAAARAPAPAAERALWLARSASSFLVVGDCSVLSLSAYLLLPPLACVLAPLLGIAAVALGSSRGLRIYAGWNQASLASVAVALALLVANARQVGAQSAVEPCVVLAAKLLSAQLVPVQLAVVEAARPLRGWRGLRLSAY